MANSVPNSALFIHQLKRKRDWAGLYRWFRQVLFVGFSNELMLVTNRLLRIDYDESELSMEICIFLHDRRSKMKIAFNGIMQTRYVLPGFIKLDFARRSDSPRQRAGSCRKIEDQIRLSNRRVETSGALPGYPASDVAGKAGKNVSIREDDFPFLQ